ASTALAAITDRNPSFMRRVFAISGVSGGSLGAAFYVSLLRDSIAANAPLPCSKLSQSSVRADSLVRSYQRCVHRLLSDDYLSPVLAMLTAPDLAQRFIPVPINWFDRSIGLEEGWAASYHDATGRRTFSDGLLTFNDTVA